MGLIGSILGGIGGLIGGAAGNSSPDPTYQRTGLSNTGNTAAAGLLKRSQQAPSEFGQQNLAGVETNPAPGNQQNQDATQRSMSALGMANAPTQAAAINQKLGQKYASQLAEVGRDANLKGVNQSITAKTNQDNAQTAMNRINQQQDLIEKQAWAEADANRNAVFTQVLGGLGGFAVNAAFDTSRMMSQINTPQGQQSNSQQEQQKNINNSPLGGAIQNGLKNAFSGE